MSQAGPKITSKNLTYDATLPPFLARLRGQQQQYSEDGPDPILAARRRPQGKPRSASEEAEDAPVVVDERGNVVQLRDGAIVDEDNGDAGVGQKEGGAEVEKADGGAAEKREQDEAEDARRRDAEKVAGIGAGRKRKVGRVVGGAGSGSGGDDDGDDGNGSTKKKSARADGADGADAKAKSTATAPKKKKAKRIKLSFGDDGE
ncbi:hypothetical protein DL769_008372 [Monosporascus sp. CRB-8-3]|nr:hypothetical protein DL769_008372 [Monosporascus sp. CRB-8-3]